MAGCTKFWRADQHGQGYEDNSQVKAAVESEGAGRVLVVDGAGSLRRALGGNLAAAAAKMAGLAW